MQSFVAAYMANFAKNKESLSPAEIADLTAKNMEKFTAGANFSNGAADFPPSPFWAMANLAKDEVYNMPTSTWMSEGKSVPNWTSEGSTSMGHDFNWTSSCTGSTNTTGTNTNAMEEFSPSYMANWAMTAAANATSHKDNDSNDWPTGNNDLDAYTLAAQIASTAGTNNSNSTTTYPR